MQYMRTIFLFMIVTDYSDRYVERYIRIVLDPFAKHYTS